MSAPPPLLQARALSVGWGVRAACAPVSFTLQAGELIAFTGPNGSGKSALLQALAGGARIHGGQVERAEGVRLNFLPQRLGNVQGLPLSGHDWLALTGASAASAPAALQPLLRRRLDEVSGGQLQALWLWASLGAAGDVLLLDEPDNHLDATMLEFLRALLRQRQCSGAGILLASHDLSFVQSLDARIIPLQAAQPAPESGGAP